MENPTYPLIIPTAAYTRILSEILRLQTTLDETMIGTGTPRAVTNYITGSMVTQALVLSIHAGYHWEENVPVLMSLAAQRIQSLEEHLHPHRETYNSVLDLVHHFPPPGTSEWQGLHFYVRLLNNFSHVVEAPTTLNGNLDLECSICLNGFHTGQRYVQLPCNHLHWLHENCLTQLASHFVFFSCPLCRRFPFVRSETQPQI
ncbi:hypothetical protein DFH28DRAFT_908079 [Melampsora americana]|nr:hypothetical protein DFH28DRAFT_908079 [Melampsora americana]